MAQALVQKVRSIAKSKAGPWTILMVETSAFFATRGEVNEVKNVI